MLRKEVARQKNIKNVYAGLDSEYRLFSWKGWAWKGESVLKDFLVAESSLYIIFAKYIQVW